MQEIPLIDQLVRAELKRQGLPVTDQPIDELIASGAFKAAEYQVQSKNMVDPDWYGRAISNKNN